MVISHDTVDLPSNHIMQQQVINSFSADDDKSQHKGPSAEVD